MEINPGNEKNESVISAVEDALKVLLSGKVPDLSGTPLEGFALEAVKAGKDPAALPKAGESRSGCDILVESIAGKFALFVSQLAEMRTFMQALCVGHLDAPTPGRRNYFSAPLKELHTQFYSLTWSMDQLAKGNVVSKLYYRGVLFEAFNRLINKVAATSAGLPPAASLSAGSFLAARQAAQSDAMAGFAGDGKQAGAAGGQVGSAGGQAAAMAGNQPGEASEPGPGADGRHERSWQDGAANAAQAAQSAQAQAVQAGLGTQAVHERQAGQMQAGQMQAAQDGRAWDWSVNSWRYHQILSALNNLSIMVLEISLDGDVVYMNMPAKKRFGSVTRITGDGPLERQLMQVKPDERFPQYGEIFDEDTGTWYKVTSDISTFINTGRTGYIHMVDNISEWKKNERSLRLKATTDPLTGLYNRRFGLSTLESALRNSDKGVTSCAAFIDMDGLKEINDKYGHNSGDYAIKVIADVLVTSVRDDKDVVCRFGGDEFIVVFNNCSPLFARMAIERMYEKIDLANKKGEAPFSVGFSVGVVELKNMRGVLVQDVIERMDAAMYKNKLQRKGARQTVAKAQ